MVRSLTREQKVSEFHKAMGLPVNYTAHDSLITLRRKLIAEEAAEVDLALKDVQLDCVYQRPSDPEKWAHLLKELCDLQYVLSGTVVSLERLNAVAFDVAFNRVHQSNMSKLGDDGLPIRDQSGKVLKGPNYIEPNLLDCV